MSTQPEEAPDDFRLDRTHFSVANLTDRDDAPAYWLSRPAVERFRALELLRRTMYGTAQATAGLQRVFEIIDLEWR